MKLTGDKLAALGKFRSYLFPLIVVVLILISTVTILKPKVNNLLKTRGDLAKQKEELAQLTQKVAILEGYDRNELEIRTNQMLKVLPTEKNGPLIFATVRSLASENNLDIESLSVEVGGIATESSQPKKKEELVPSLKIQLGVSGGLNNLYDFLEAIESTVPLMRIESINIDREGTSLEGKVQLVTYYFAAPKDIGEANRQIVPLTTREEALYQQLSAYQPVAAAASLPYIGSGKENPFTF